MKDRGFRTGVDEAGAADKGDARAKLEARLLANAAVEVLNGGVGDVLAHIPEALLDHMAQWHPVDAAKGGGRDEGADGRR